MVCLQWRQEKTVSKKKMKKKKKHVIWYQIGVYVEPDMSCKSVERYVYFRDGNEYPSIRVLGITSEYQILKPELGYSVKKYNY